MKQNRNYDESRGHLFLQLFFVLAFIFAFASVAVPFLVPDIGGMEYSLSFNEVPALAGMLLSVASLYVSFQL